MALLLLAGAAQAVDFDPATPAPGNMRFAWIHGSVSAKHNTDVRVQVHRYNEHTYILRQNPAVHWEAPFMYLLFGEQRALLIDTGATEEPEFFPLRKTVDALIERWTAANGQELSELVVITTGDAPAQTTGLSQFRDRPGTRVISGHLGAADESAADEGAAADMAGLKFDTDGSTILDLGGRRITVLATPGVSASGVTVYDPYTDFLFTGSALLPGRVVIRDFDAYSTSLERLQAFAAQHPVKWLMGAQIDMSTTPGVDYRLRSNYRPAEHPLQLPPSALGLCYDVVHLINGRRQVEILADFIVMNGVGRGERPYGYPVYSPDFTGVSRPR